MKTLLATALVATLSGASVAQPVAEKDCSQTSVGLTPIDRMMIGDAYLGFAGGLYPNGNEPPAQHVADLHARFENLPQVIGFTSAGMSNAEMIWAGQQSPDPVDATSFMGKAQPSPGVVLITGAQGGNHVDHWRPGGRAWDEVPNRLERAGVSADDVIFCWAFHALPPGSTINQTQEAIGEFLREVKRQWPKLRVVYMSSGNYHGYSTREEAEPHSYETGWAAKFTIGAQIEQRADGAPDPVSGDLRYWGPNPPAPLVTWGPYVWRDGLPDWDCDDFRDDGVHPSTDGIGTGQDKWSDHMGEFFMTSPHAGPWFNEGAPAFVAGDLDQDGQVSTLDLLILLGAWGACADCGGCPADLDNNCFVNAVDLLMLLGNWG